MSTTESFSTTEECTIHSVVCSSPFNLKVLLLWHFRQSKLSIGNFGQDRAREWLERLLLGFCKASTQNTERKYISPCVSLKMKIIHHNAFCATPILESSLANMWSRQPVKC